MLGEKFIFLIVTMKLIDAKIDDAPAKCREKIAMSTGIPLWLICEDKGGYTVQPVPTPPSIEDLIIRRVSDGVKSQKLMLLSRGSDMSGADNISGVSQLPKPPIIIGITMKKIIINAWAVTITL